MNMNIRTPLACLPLIFATSCYDTQPSVSTGNGGPGAGTQGPFALGPVLYFDLSGDSRGAEGNRLELRFDRPVALGDPSELDLRLPTPGDSFGEFTALVDPDSPDTLGIWLGPDAQLRTRGLAGSGIPQTGRTGHWPLAGQ